MQESNIPLQNALLIGLLSAKKILPKLFLCGFHWKENSLLVAILKLREKQANKETESLKPNSYLPFNRARTWTFEYFNQNCLEQNKPTAEDMYPCVTVPKEPFNFEQKFRHSL